MSKITKQSEFAQRKYNEAKMGAYYTDVGHCRMLSRFLEFPEEEEVCCLEPSIGDGAAVLAVTGKENGGKEHVKVFGVELNEATCSLIEGNEKVDYCLHADFLNDALITQHAFSFCFMNPPYGTQEDGMRYETAFLRKVVPYLSRDAVMIAVVPVYVAGSREFAVDWCTNFNTRYFWRFHEKEYAKYRQVVLIGVKRDSASEEAERAARLMEEAKDPGKIPLLPEEYDGERIMVAKSVESFVTEFMPQTFREEESRNYLSHSPLNGLVKDRVGVPPYLIDNLGRPPILPSEGHMYLLAVSGAGQGLVGSEENKDLHLQRGTSKIVKKSEYVKDEDGNMKEVVTSYPQVSFNLIEADGNIRTLQ